MAPLVLCYVLSPLFSRFFSTVLPCCLFDTRIPFCCPPPILTMNQLTEKQKARSELRSQFLLTLNVMKGREVTMNLYGTKNPIKATFAGFDPKFRNFLVTDLCSSVGVVDSAVIRATDVISMRFQDGK